MRVLAINFGVFVVALVALFIVLCVLTSLILKELYRRS